MEINHENAMKLWTERFGKGVEQANDRKGRTMLKTAFGDTGSKYGWNIHHMKEKSKGGGNAKENLEIVHMKTHEELNR